MTLGKHVADDWYLHASAIEDAIDGELRAVAKCTRASIESGSSPNVLKVNVRARKLSWLEYEDFDSAPFPRLLASWTFAIDRHDTPNFRSYRVSLNPPILHRKELLVSTTYPQRKKWVELTEVAESLGLFDDTKAIGFQLNWLKTIESKGYQLQADAFHPIGNNFASDVDVDSAAGAITIQRHLTALSRVSLSAPVQMLLRHGLLIDGTTSFFDYGCGRGNDVEVLKQNGFQAHGWDPHYANDHPRVPSDLVNLGFVINVIEDPLERVEALYQAFKLTKRALAFGVMLYPTELTGVPYQDGVLTTRSTFQKYFTQGEIKAFVEDVLQSEVFMVGPGVGFVFVDKIWQQAFESARYRTGGVANRLTRIPRTKIAQAARIRPATRTSRSQQQVQDNKALLDDLWLTSLTLGRFPEKAEIASLLAFDVALITFNRAVRLLMTSYDMAALDQARKTRIDDLTVYLAIQQFSKRGRYRNLEPRVQRDIKAFFGDYSGAQSNGYQLLMDCASADLLSRACVLAASEGLGWLIEGHSLQLHCSLVERLPALLRVYFACGLVLWDSVSAVQLIKIHIGSGKLSLMEFDDFDGSPLPTLRKRVKVNLRKLDYSIFEYGSAEHPKPLLYFKSRFLHEEHAGFAEQLAFDDELSRTGCVVDGEYGPSAAELAESLASKRLAIKGMELLRSCALPGIDDKCGRHLSYRSLIECGETQSRLGIQNLPKNVETYNALHDLATCILDATIDYFGGIRLTYGLCTAELGRHVKKRVAHNLDQHSACEVKRSGRFICERLGAACDFIVEDQDMLEVAEWIVLNLPFDRLYYYGKGSPLHVSFGPDHSRIAVQMIPNKAGLTLPRPLKFG